MAKKTEDPETVSEIRLNTEDVEKMYRFIRLTVYLLILIFLALICFLLLGCAFFFTGKK